MEWLTAEVYDPFTQLGPAERAELYSSEVDEFRDNVTDARLLPAQWGDFDEPVDC